jgi:hypothetical protein
MHPSELASSSGPAISGNPTSQNHNRWALADYRPTCRRKDWTCLRGTHFHRTPADSVFVFEFEGASAWLVMAAQIDEPHNVEICDSGPFPVNRCAAGHPVDLRPHATKLTGLWIPKLDTASRVARQQTILRREKSI